MPSFLERVVDKIDNPSAPTTPTRALDATFTPSATDYVLCLYTIELVATATQTAQVELRSDAAVTPTVVRTSARLTLAATAVLTTIRQELVYIAAPGDNVKLVSSGAGTSSIVNQTEIVIS